MDDHSEILGRFGIYKVPRGNDSVKLLDGKTDIPEGSAMVAGLEADDLKISGQIADSIMETAKLSLDAEVCGLLTTKDGGDEVVFCENLAHKKRERFMINPRELLKAGERGETITAIFHTHIDEAENLSLSDMYACEALQIPYIVYSVKSDRWCIYTPVGYKFPLLGRNWLAGVQDCHTLTSDYFARSKLCKDCSRWSPPELANLVCYFCGGSYDYDSVCDLKIPEIYREEYWWNKANDDGSPKFDYLSFTGDLGFASVPIETIRENDVLIMQWPDIAVAHHLGVYLGKQEILHHLPGILSGRQILGGELLDRIVKVVRYKPWLKKDDVWQ